ncbi:3231_t:CDS:2 [Paraglomus occultum]|uniref:3231_t:CDS:1 n=1 Tax=Paraglomus occultum TaxID=144539 RepID=A0A9N8ZHK0_9GLOM|nr:3231_t:CDS:2 [Paraglomus occultum]
MSICPYIGFAGSVSSHKVLMDPLTVILPLECHDYDVEMKITAARFFHAFKIAVQELKEYYEKILPRAHEHNLCNSKFPYINSYYDEWEKRNVSFTWFEQYEDKLIFAEKEENKDTICIKLPEPTL